MAGYDIALVSHDTCQACKQRSSQAVLAVQTVIISGWLIYCVLLDIVNSTCTCESQPASGTSDAIMTFGKSRPDASNVNFFWYLLQAGRFRQLHESARVKPHSLAPVQA